MATLFTRIIEGEIPGTFVWRDPAVVAFLSINPVNPGHVLVVPRAEIDHWIDCPDDLRNRLFEVSQIIGRALQAVWEPPKVALMAIGLEVPHLHLHVVPIWGMGDVDFSAARPAAREDLDSAAARIREQLAADLGQDGNGPAFE